MTNKNLRTVLLAFSLSLTLSCLSQDTINKNRLNICGNCVYCKKGTNIPFTGMSYQRFFMSGKINYIPMENGILSGNAIGYYRSGAKKWECTYKFGEKNGEEIGYYESGTIQSRWLYQNGKKNGEEINYYENGVIKSKMFLKNDKLQGKAISYYSSGMKEYEAEYDRGIIQSDIKYNEDGTVLSSDKYLNGKKIK